MIEGHVTKSFGPLSVRVQPYLIAGSVVSAPGAVKIVLSDGLSREEAALTFWHELVHLLLLIGGRPGKEHNEALVEEVATRLAFTCPEVLTMLGLDDCFEPIKPEEAARATNPFITKGEGLPVVLYFRSDDERAEFVRQVMEVKPNLKPKNL